MKSLITKLNGNVNNNALLKIGEIRLKYTRVSLPTPSSQCFSLKSYSEQKLEIIGDGYFTDETLQENLGTTIVVSPNVITNIYSSNGNYEISIPNKYSITVFSLAPSSVNVYLGDYVNSANKYISLNAFKYAINLFSLNLSSTKVDGDLSALAESTKLQYLCLARTSVTGDIKVFDKMHNLTGLNILLTKVSGDISNLHNTNIIDSDIQMTDFLYGNVGDLPDTMLYVNNQGGASHFTWTGTSRKYILAAIYIRCDSIDKMLTDMSELEAKFKDQSIVRKSISLIGNRTSKSDEAVAILQNKGYTVSIIPV